MGCALRLKASAEGVGPMARRLKEKFELSRVGDFPVNRLLWLISESNRHPAVRLLSRGTFLCRRRYTRKLRQRLAIAFTLCTTRSAARRLVGGRLLLSSPPAALLRHTNVNLAPFDPHSGHRTDGGLRMMNQSAGSEVVGTLAPRCYQKIANVLSAQTCFPSELAQ